MEMGLGGDSRAWPKGHPILCVVSAIRGGGRDVPFRVGTGIAIGDVLNEACAALPSSSLHPLNCRYFNSRFPHYRSHHSLSAVPGRRPELRGALSGDPAALTQLAAVSDPHPLQRAEAAPGTGRALHGPVTAPDPALAPSSPVSGSIPIPGSRLSPAPPPVPATLHVRPGPRPAQPHPANSHRAPPEPHRPAGAPGKPPRGRRPRRRAGRSRRCGARPAALPTDRRTAPWPLRQPRAAAPPAGRRSHGRGGRA